MDIYNLSQSDSECLLREHGVWTFLKEVMELKYRHNGMIMQGCIIKEGI